MKLLRITNIQRGCVYDGPGVRTTLFLKGCSLDCPWCCNPETKKYDVEWYVDNSKCLKYNGKKSVLCDACERNKGINRLKDCPFGVAEKVCKDYNKDQLLELIMRDYELFKKTNGGVTFSGGEPLMQSTPLQPLLIDIKRVGINIAFETSLCAGIQNLNNVIPYADTLIVDLKLQPQMKLNDKDYLDSIVYAKQLLNKKSVYYRMVYVESMKKCIREIFDNLKYIGVEELEVLPCHKLGEKKYNKLSINFLDMSVNSDEVLLFADYLNQHNIYTNVLSV